MLQALKSQLYKDVTPLCIEELNDPAPVDDSQHEMKVLLLQGTFNQLFRHHKNALLNLSKVIGSDAATMAMKVNALIKRASMHVQLESIEQNYADFKAAVALDPKCGDIYHNHGQVSA